MIAEISWGVYSWSPRVTVTSWPIFRLIDRMVRSGASTYWLRAGLPTSSRPCGIEADDRRQDRVAVLLGRTTGWPSRMTATSLLVVPRSMPMMVSMSALRLHSVSSQEGREPSSSSRSVLGFVFGSSVVSLRPRVPGVTRALWPASWPAPRRGGATRPRQSVASPQLLDHGTGRHVRRHPRPRRRSSARGRRARPRHSIRSMSSACISRRSRFWISPYPSSSDSNQS